MCTRVSAPDVRGVPHGRGVTGAGTRSQQNTHQRMLRYPDIAEAAHRRQALAEARRVLRPGGRLLAMAVCRFASLLDGLYQGWLDDPDFRPIVDQDVTDGQHRNPDPVGRPEFSPPPISTPRMAWRARSDGPVSPARPSTGSRARAGRCAGSGPTRSGASRSCSRPGQSKPSPRSSASVTISSPRRPSRRRAQPDRATRGMSGRPSRLFARRCGSRAS